MKRRFFQEIFFVVQVHTQKHFKWCFEKYNAFLTWHEKQSKIVKMWHCHFILLFVAELQVTSETQFYSSFKQNN